MARVCVFVCWLFLSWLCSVFGMEVSLWNISVNSEESNNLQVNNPVFRKTLYANSTIFMKFHGDVAAFEDKNLAFNVSWYLRSSVCYNEVFNIPDSYALKIFGSDQKMKDWTGFYSQGYIYFNSCSALITHKTFYKEYQPCLSLNDLQDSTDQTRRNWNEKPLPYAVSKSWMDSPYLFIVKFQTIQLHNADRGHRETKNEAVAHKSQDQFSITMTIEIKGPHDYISPADWPLMMFFMVMCIVYVFFGALWLFWLVCYWRDLLRIQFWIGAVIILGMLEKAVFYSEYQSIKYYGHYDQNAVIFAELLSALKRSLSRILLIIVSLGYGIVKPRLGTTVPRLVAVGLIYLISSSVEGVLRVTGGFYGTVALVANIILAFTDSCVILWVFMSLSQTIRLLKLRRNVVKLSLYQHFTNTLIFSVLASIVFIAWTTRQFKLVDCQLGWRELWVDDAFWRLLFSTILLAIMVLLRPSINSQRFSHSPLIDENNDDDDDDDEAKEPMLNEAFEGMKMRGSKFETNASQKLLSKESSQDEDMKWVEENIPTAVVDLALPAMLDEEEELKTKLERSKME